MTRAVALFLYNRPDLTARVFEAITAARPRVLFLLADGPNPSQPDDRERCEGARQAVERVDWQCEVIRDFSPNHLGQRQRVESGFAIVFDAVAEAILLEDDTLPSPDFFRFCEGLLEFHRNDTRVLSIGGSALHLGRSGLLESYAFSRYPCSGGWATWKRAITSYDPHRRHPKNAPDTLTWLEQHLGDPIAAKYWAHLFESSAPEGPSWDYIWTRSGFLQDGLHAIPRWNLISNLGFREDATVTRRPCEFSALPLEPLDGPLGPQRVERSAELDAILEDTVYSGHLRRALSRVRELTSQRRRPRSQ